MNQSNSLNARRQETTAHAIPLDPIVGERTPLACCFRWPAENFVPLTLRDALMKSDERKSGGLPDLTREPRALLARPFGRRRGSRVASRSVAIGPALAMTGLLLAGTLGSQEIGPPNLTALKARAYELMQQRRLPEAADQFKAYLEKNPGDVRATYDYGSLLSQLNRHGDAIQVLEKLRAANPTHDASAFKLGTEYVTLGRTADAERIFEALQKSPNREFATAATEALTRLRAQNAKQSRYDAESRVFELAKELRHEEVVTAVDDLAKQGELPFPLAMQRLYSLTSLKRYQTALDHANALAEKNPQAIDLMLVRADLLNQLGRQSEAIELWRRIEREAPGTAAASEASRRLAVDLPPPPPVEDKIYALAREQRHGEVVAAINELEQKGPLSWPMEMQRLYAWQALGDDQNALAKASQLTAQQPQSTELALMQSDLLLRNRRWSEASEVLQRVQRENPGTPVAREAALRLDAIPAISNRDKWGWGEAYAAGTTMSRFGDLIGGGFIRQGVFIPKARWLQPYAEFQFSADTKSGAGRQSTVVAANYVGLFGGVRVQPFEGEYLFAYAQGGTTKDLLDRRNDGDFAADYQVGAYGFKSWGPGITLWPEPAQASSRHANYVARRQDPDRWPSTDLFFWRGDGFVDVGGNFSYYHRYASWIGYGQAHEGFRLFQYGPNVGFDGYLVENLTWDVRGNYFDNFVEAGPGVRALWKPFKRWEVVARAEFLGGWYLGRDGKDNRGSTDRTYRDFRFGLSVGGTW